MPVSIRPPQAITIPVPKTTATKVAMKPLLRWRRVRTARRIIVSPPASLAANARRGGSSGRRPARPSERSRLPASPPSARNTTWSAYDAATGSWVTITTVWPWRPTGSRSSSRTSRGGLVSSAPVGSSAKITAGRATSARAIATRCCWPPDSSPGRCLRLSAEPDAVQDLRDRGAVDPSAVELLGQGHVLPSGQRRERLKDWNTNPIRSRRSSVSLARSARPAPSRR